MVQLADGSVREFCVDLGGPERTGEELLRLSGLDVVAEVSALGTLVCRIGGSGCDSSSRSRNRLYRWYDSDSCRHRDGPFGC